MNTLADPWIASGPFWSADPGTGPAAREGRHRSVMLVPMAVAALLLALLGPTAPSFLSWALPSSTAPRAEAPVVHQGPPGADAIASQVDHLLIADATEPGVLTVADDRYAGRFDAAGFSLTPSAGGDGFAVSLRDIRLGGQDIAVTAGGWTADGRVARRTVAPGITEQVTANDGTVEWDVVLGQAPAGAGDLVVEADVSGTPSGTTGDTMNWSVDGRTVSMGEMVVKDASGSELYRALPTSTATGVALTVPGSVLAGAAYPLLVDPVISPEYPVTDGATGGESDIVFDGTNYFVVWSDARNDSSTDPVRTTEVYGARLSPTGTRLDGNGFRITNDNTDDLRWPSVAFDGNNFLVVWNSSGPECGPNGWRCVRAARVSRSGNVLDPAGLVVAGGAGEITDPDVAFDGTNYLVVYADNTGADVDIFANRVTPAGTVQAPFPVAVAPSYQYSPSVASDGVGSSLVVWADQRNGGDIRSPGDVYSSRVGRTGGALDPQGVVVSAAPYGQEQPSVAWNGNRYLVAWTDGRGSVDEYIANDIYGARVSRRNVVEDPSGILISADGYGRQTEPSVAASGPTFLVVWSDYRSDTQIYANRVDDAGARLDGTGFPVTSGDALHIEPAATGGPGSTWGTTFTTRENGALSGTVILRTVAPK
jgi:hypothetical protein